MEDEPDMTTNQPSQDLQVLNVFDDKLMHESTGALEVYNPIFSKIRIYGTTDVPVFVAKDVQEVLGLKDMSYKRDDGPYEWGEDRIKVKVMTKMGPRDMVAFTEHGLYHAIWMSKTQAAKNFQTFMSCVMKRLRMTGSVTMEEAVSDLRAKLAKTEGTLRAYGMQLDETHKSLMHYKFEHDDLVLSNYDHQIALDNAKKRLENQRDPDAYASKERNERIMRRTGRAIVVMLNRPPKEYEEDCEYDFDMFGENDEDIVDRDQDMYFSIGLSELKSKTTIKKVYVHKTIKLEDVHNALEKYQLYKHNKDGDRTTPYTNMYEISLDRIEDVIDTLNRKDEAAHQE